MRVVIQPTTSAYLPTSLERIRPRMLVCGSLAEKNTKHICSVTLYPRMRSPLQVLLSKHSQRPNELAERRPPMESCSLAGPMNLHKSASWRPISFDRTAGNLPRVVFTLGPSKPPRQQVGSPMGMLSGLVLKLEGIWKTMPETSPKRTKGYSISDLNQMSNSPIDR